MRLPDPLPIDLASLRQRTIVLGDVRVAYAEGGAGAPVLLLHGAIFAGNVFWWEAAARLARDHRVIAPDFPGWGASDRPAGTYAMDWYHAFIDAFLDALGLSRVVLVGHSMGALLASSYALLRPERVAAVALVAAPPAWVAFDLPLLFRPFTVPLLGEVALGALPILGRDHPLGVRRFYEGLMRAPEGIRHPRMATAMDGCIEATRDPAHRDAFLRTLRANQILIRRDVSEAFAARLKSRRLPALLLAGREDALFPLPLVARGLGVHDGVRLEALAGCGHFPMWERAAEVEALLAAFLADHAALAA